MATNAERCRRYRGKNLEKERERKRKLKRENPELCAKQKREWYQRHKAEIAEKRRERRKKRKVSQPAACEICQRVRILFWDHCHKSGKFRGWLCNSCNAALGMVHDDPNHLKVMIAYLEKHKPVVE